MKLSTAVSAFFIHIQLTTLFAQEMDGFFQGGKLNILFNLKKIFFEFKSFLFNKKEQYNNTKPFQGYSTAWGKHLGCYRIETLKSNPFLKSQNDSKSLSVEKCWTFCAKQSFMFDGYVGLHNGLKIGIIFIFA